MKYVAPLLVIFALLTQPDGHTIAIAKSQVVAVFRNTGECVGTSPRADREDTRSIVMLGNGARICVAEQPESVRSEVEKP